MMLTTLIGAMTLALGPCNANHAAKDVVTSPGIIEIRAGMINDSDVQRRQIRFSDQTRGRVVATVDRDGGVRWPSSDREKLGGQNAPELIYVQMFDGVFAIDPFQPLPAANDSTAAMLFRGTTLETDRTQHGRQQIDRTRELFRKLEQARIQWLRDNGFYGVRTVTNPKAASADKGEQAKGGKGLPEPSAVFERPADMPRGKSREQVQGDDQPAMTPSVAAMINRGVEPIRVSMPDTHRAPTVARVERRADEPAVAKSQAQDQDQNQGDEPREQVAIDK